jgi:hypothetical protein
MSYLYHGTMTADIKVLNANSYSHTTNSSVVYLTPNRAYALFYIRDKNINWVTCAVNKEGVVIYHENFPNQLEKLYKGISGYIYGCTYDDVFKETPTTDVWQTDNSVIIYKTEYISDVYDVDTPYSLLNIV